MSSKSIEDWLCHSIGTLEQLSTIRGVLVAVIVVLINIAAVWSNYGKTQASGFAVVSLIAAVWAFGIFANFRRNPMNAPNYAVLLSTASGISGLVCLIIGLSA